MRGSLCTSENYENIVLYPIIINEYLDLVKEEECIHGLVSHIDLHTGYTPNYKNHSYT